MATGIETRGKVIQTQLNCTKDEWEKLYQLFWAKQRIVGKLSSQPHEAQLRGCWTLLIMRGPEDL